MPRSGARRNRGEAGRGRGAGPSARGAGGACDHAARGPARSAARRRRRGEQWRPRPPERRVRCWCCCGGCWCCGAAAGWAAAGWAAASAARAGPPITRQLLCRPRRQAETSGERPGGPRREPDNGGSGRASPLHSRNPGPGPPRRPGTPDLALAMGAWGLRGGRWTLGRCPGVCGADPPGGTRALCEPLGIPLEGTCGHAESSGTCRERGTFLFLLSFPRRGMLSRGPRLGSRLRRGGERDSGISDVDQGLGSRTLGSLDSEISDADQGQPSTPACATLLCLTSAKPFHTNSCCPNSDEPPV